MSVKQFLAKPFPQEEGFDQTLKIIAAISTFVVLFLYIFQPFGLHQIESGLFLLCLGFGAASLAASVAYEFVIVFVFKFKGGGTHFTFGHWIVYFIGAMFCISLANFVFVRLVLFDGIDWSLFPYMIRGTFAIGVFPVIVIGALAVLRQERKYQRIADEVNQRDSLQERNRDDHSERIHGIPATQIRYIEAMQNYVKIGYVNARKEFSKRSERATLKGLSEQINSSSIVRCHRSYLVNRDCITATSGNAQGLILSLSDCPKEIPVARRYVSVFRAKQGAD